LADLSGRELTILLSLVAALLFLGLYPQPVLNVSAGAMSVIQQSYAPVAVSVPLLAP
jgi:NADH-quinone oxidoreductase subunit M